MLYHQSRNNDKEISFDTQNFYLKINLLIKLFLSVNKSVNVAVFTPVAKYTKFMGNLPEPRIVPRALFPTKGVYFVVQFFIKSSKGRQWRASKCYLCRFDCVTTKVINSGLFTELTPIAFLQRFYFK